MRKTRQFLFLAILLCSSKVFAAASSVDFTAGGIAYHITNSTTQTVEVTALADGALYTGDITIPATVTYGSTTYAVTSIAASAFKGKTKLTSATIPNSVTSIESSAFYDCYGLTSVNISSSVTSIGKYAFKYCSGLTSLFA